MCTTCMQQEFCSAWLAAVCLLWFQCFYLKSQVIGMQMNCVPCVLNLCFLIIYFDLILCYSVRGVIGSSFILSANFGMLFAFIIGNYFNFYMFPKVVIAIIIVYTVALLFIPESPAFLMKQNKVAVSKVCNAASSPMSGSQELHVLCERISVVLWIDRVLHVCLSLAFTSSSELRAHAIAAYFLILIRDIL